MSRSRDTANQINRVNSSAADATAITVDSSENVLIGGTTVASSSGGLNIEVSSSGSSVVPLTLQNQSTGNNSGVYLTFRGQSNTGAQADYTYIQSVADDTTAGNGSIRFHTNGGGTIAERMRILPSGGITFNGDTAAANALDDYEEGTWTPTLKGSSGNPSGQSYSKRTGTYTKVGRKVHVQAYISVSNIGTGMSGSYAYLSDLPFTLSAGNSNYSSGLFGYIHNLGQNVNSLLAYGNQGSNFAYVTYQNGGGTTSAYLSPAGWGSTPSVMFSMTYFTDS